VEIEKNGSIDSNICNLTKAIIDSDSKAKAGTLSTKFHLTKMKDNLNFQKSRVQGITEGDANTKYFHSCLNLRRRNNYIATLKNEEFWVEQIEEVRSILKSNSQRNLKTGHSLMVSDLRSCCKKSC
jgi:hypothetical protein